MSAVAAARAALAGAVAAAVLLLGAPPASAHTQLLGVAPGPGEVVPEGAPVTVTLTFSEAVDPALSTVVVVDSAERVVAADAPRVDGAAVHQVVRGLSAGEHTIRYRVVSADGHPVDGESAFSVQAAPGPTTAAPSPETSTTGGTTPSGTATPSTATSARAAPTVPRGDAGDRDGGSALSLGLGAAFLLLTAAGGGALAARRRRADPRGSGVDG